MLSAVEFHKRGARSNSSLLGEGSEFTAEVVLSHEHDDSRRKVVDRTSPSRTYIRKIARS